MRYISALILFFGIFFQTSAFAVTDAQGTAIFKDLVKQYEKQYGNLPLIALYYDMGTIFPNASISDECPGSQGETICIMIVYSWINELTPGQYAAIVGHELGHYYNGDLYGLDLYTQKRETMADTFGINLAQASGYNGCEVDKIWKKFAGSDHRMENKASTHPTPWSRHIAISKQCGLPY